MWNFFGSHPKRQNKFVAEDEFWTRKSIDALYVGAVEKARELQLRVPSKPTESCSCCGRQRYGGCGCPDSDVGTK